MILLSQARSLPMLIVMAFLTGLAGESYRPASSALLADLIPEKHRVTAYAGYRFAINAGFAFGPAVAGFLAHYSYFWLFLGDAITSALYGLIALVFLPREPKRPSPGWSFISDAARSLAEAGRVAASDRRFRRLVLASFGTGWVFLQMVSTLGLQVKAAGYSDQVFGFVLALNGVLIVLFEIPLCSITQRLPARPVIAVGFALIAFGAGLYAWLHTVWGFALGMAVLTLGEMLSMPVSLAYAANLAPESMRGRYMGVYGLTWAAALTCGPSLGVLLFGWQPAALWMSCLGVGLLSTAIIAGGGRDRSPKAPPAFGPSPNAPVAGTAGES
jgi:MFS family permease